MSNIFMNTFYAKNRQIWRNWLEQHFKNESEVWLVFPLKASGKDGVSYNDAVEEALCFGWIDSTYRSLDSENGIRRFTPRRKGSSYSQPNIERLIWLNNRGMIHPDIQKEICVIINSEFFYPEDIIEELKKDRTVWINYCNFSEPYCRIRIAYIQAARKRPEEFKKRLENFIDKTRKGQLISGYGGIDKYYS